MSGLVRFVCLVSCLGILLTLIAAALAPLVETPRGAETLERWLGKPAVGEPMVVDTAARLPVSGVARAPVPALASHPPNRQRRDRTDRHETVVATGPPRLDWQPLVDAGPRRADFAPLTTGAASVPVPPVDAIRPAGFQDTPPKQDAASAAAPVQPVESGPKAPERNPAHEPVPVGSTTRPGHVELNVRGDDVRSVLMLLSQLTNRNIIASEFVKGAITLQLHDVSLDTALDAICKVKGYVVRRHEGLMYVASAQEALQLEHAGAKSGFRVFRPIYVSGKTLQDLLTPYLTQTGRIAVTSPSSVGIESNANNAGGDAFANSDVVIVQDLEPVLELLEKLVADIDQKPTQVLIEAVLLSVQLNNTHEMGVNFAILNQASSALGVFGSGAAVNNAGFQPTQLVAQTAAEGSAGQLTKGFADSRNGLKFGFVDDDFTGFLQLLETVGQTTVLANPKLLVLNKQRAELIIGKRLGYKTLVTTETSAVESVQFLDVGTQLRIRPFVQSDGTIRMELHPERSTGTVSATTGLPEEETTEMTTNVMVPDGATIVLGGLIEDQKERVVEQIPFLGSLPFLGRLFRDETEATSRRELVILITPRIVNLAGAADEALAALAEFTERHDRMGRSLTPTMRVALARKHYEQAMSSHLHGDATAAQRHLKWTLHFDPTHAEANRLQAFLDAQERLPDPESGGAETGRLVPSPEPAPSGDGPATLEPADRGGTLQSRAPTNATSHPTARESNDRSLSHWSPVTPVNSARPARALSMTQNGHEVPHVADRSTR